MVTIGKNVCNHFKTCNKLKQPVNQNIVSAILIIIIVSDQMGDKKWCGTTISIKCNGQYLCDTVKTAGEKITSRTSKFGTERRSQDDWE